VIGRKHISAQETQLLMVGMGRMGRGCFAHRANSSVNQY
jgi:hypothetical protein